MKGCESCGYNELTSNFECYKCQKKESKYSYEYYDAYAYVTNTFKCFNNSDPNQVTFYGCLKAYYNETTNETECLECEDHEYRHIYIENEKICKNPSDIDLMNCRSA